MWICIGYLTITLANVKTDYSSYYLGTFSSQQECLDHGEKWSNKHKNIHTEAEYICEPDKMPSKVGEIE
jgi:hypothetical protein